MPRHGGSVLVVDDDRINRALLSRLLDHEGYRPRTAVNGREALAALNQEPFDAVLLDIVMPEVDGMEVLRTLKADARLWRIPVIVISGLEDTESIVACLELGADDYVQKPFDPVLLRARLNACLARRQFHVLEVEYQKVVQEQAAELEALRRDANEATRETADNTPPGGDACLAPVAVLTVGLGGLSAFATEADPAAALAVVDAFQATMGALAGRFDGAVSARAADTLTVVFGGPSPCPDLAASGLAMAGALGEAMTPLRSGWGDGHGSTPTWAAGLAVGEAAVGVVANRGSRHVVAVGSVVDRATRLRDLSPPGEVLIDEGAFAATQLPGVAEGFDAEQWEGAASTRPPVYRLRRRHANTGGYAPPGPTTAG